MCTVIASIKKKDNTEKHCFSANMVCHAVFLGRIAFMFSHTNVNYPIDEAKLVQNWNGK